MSKIDGNALWKFDEISRIKDRKFDADLEKFVKLSINGLVRENIQNSLDAKLLGLVDPVIVEIKTGKILKEDIPNIEMIVERVNSLKGGNEYSLETIEYMLQAIKKPSPFFISFEDKNTKGLSDETWDIYAYEKGSHYIEKDEVTEASRGGSHGVGKIASNAASDIHMMFFANCDEFGNQYLGGNIQLLEHEHGGKVYGSTGYFTDVNDKKVFKPYENKFDTVFKKNTRGLKIVIPFLREAYYKETEIIRAVCDNFFVAILQENLKVLVNEFVIDKTNIESILKDDIYYNYDKHSNPFTRLYVYTYTNCKSIPLVIKDKEGNIYNFDFYFSYNDDIKRGRVAVIRTIGMKIEDFQVQGHSKTPFNAVLIPKSSTEDSFLKSLENESHTELSAKSIRNKKKKENATRFLNNLEKELISYIAEILKKENPTDGALDTKDLLYSVEHKFQRDLEKNRNTVIITGSGGEKNKLIVKTSVRRKKKKTTHPRTGSRHTGGTTSIKPNSNDKNKQTPVYSIDTNHARRIVINNQEDLYLNFSENSRYENQTECNVHIKLVDGQGNISEELINLNEYYESIKDITTNTVCLVKENRIINVPMLDGKIALKMDMMSNINNELKFVYYVEVD